MAEKFSLRLGLDLENIYLLLTLVGTIVERGILTHYLYVYFVLLLKESLALGPPLLSSGVVWALAMKPK